MRILYVINAFYRAGAEKLVYDLAIHMAGQVQWIGIAAVHARSDDTEKDMVEALNQQGIETFILDKREHRDRLATVRKLVAIIRSRQPDLLHAHCMSPGHFAKLSGLLTRRPVVYTIHSTRGYSARQERATQWMVQKFVSIGAGAEAYMTEELGLDPRKIQRIYNGIDTAGFGRSTGSAGFWSAWGGRETDTVILNAARVVPVKNQLCQIRAIEKCREQGREDLKLYILGDFCPEDPLCRSLLDYVQAHGLENAVHFLGMRSNVADFMANADCFVMTSRYEGLSVAFLEAVVSGLPVITTDLAFVHELNAIAPCAVMIPQDDSGALAEALLQKDYFRPEPETVRTFQTLFSMNLFVQNHMELYRSVVEHFQK